jgi:hypothetical protein
MRMVEKVARIRNGGQQLSFKEVGRSEHPPQTEAEVAKDYQWLGQINCGPGVGTANVTIARDVITTAAHVFYDKDCKQRVPDLNKCIFIPAYARRNGSYSQAPEGDKFSIIASTLHVGTKCTLEPFRGWAVVRLSRPVPIERPAQVLDIPDDMDAKELDDYLKSTMIVTATRGNHNRAGYTVDDPTICPNGKSYAAYQLYVDGGPMEVVVHTCSNRHGDSGGSIAVSQLLPDGSMTDTRMIGVETNGSSIKNNNTEFSLSNLSSGALLVGQFRKALDDLVRQSRSPDASKTGDRLKDTNERQQSIDPDLRPAPPDQPPRSWTQFGAFPLAYSDPTVAPAARPMGVAATRPVAPPGTSVAVKRSGDQPTVISSSPGAPAQPPSPDASKSGDRFSEVSSPPQVQAHTGWIIQVGAFPALEEAKQRLSSVQGRAARFLASADPFTDAVSKGDTILYRARFGGLVKEHAEAACNYLKRNDVECVTIRN